LVKSIDKGKRGEREWAKFCRRHGFDCRRGQQYSGIEGEDVVGLPHIHQEVKRVERLEIYNAIEQSIKDAKDGEIPIVAHKKNRKPWLVMMDANDWFKLYKAWVSLNE
jgi:Holliday junction resolvase